MINTLTYNDLQLKTTEDERIDFIWKAIADHESSEMFKIGQTAGQFYRNVDPILESQKNYVYDANGNAIEDTVSPNHKLMCGFFHLFTTQLVSYLLGNGITFKNPEIKNKLGGSDFDYNVQQVLIYAACDGEGYGFVTKDGITPLCYACKVEGDEAYLIPLKDEDDGKIKAAIRYWRLAPEKPLRATLFELDGMKEYKETVDSENNPTGELTILKEKQSYLTSKTSNGLQGDYDISGSNYSTFPIVPMRFICGQSSIEGNIGLLHAYNVTLSNMANGVDMNTTYWKIKGADSMDRKDDNNLLYDIYKSHIIHTPENTEVEKDEVSTRSSEYQIVLERIEDELYKKFQGVRISEISSSNKTTTEIQAAYQNLNLRCDAVEKYVSRFIRGCLAVLGLDPNEPFEYNRPKDINQSEFVQLILSALPVIGDETALKQILAALGLIDEYENIKAQREQEEMDRFTGGSDDDRKQQFIVDIAKAVVEMILPMLQARTAAEIAQNATLTEE